MEKKYNILVVDDNISTTEVISMVLQHAGYTITTDPNANLEFLSTGLNPDLLLMDNQVGEKCGASICEELKRNDKTSNIPIILFSGIDDLKEVALRASADDYLPKPFSLEVLLEKIESVLLRKLIPC